MTKMAMQMSLIENSMDLVLFLISLPLQTTKTSGARTGTTSDASVGVDHCHSLLPTVDETVARKRGEKILVQTIFDAANTDQ